MDGMCLSAAVAGPGVPSWLDHPAFGPLLHKTEIAFGRVETSSGMVCPASHRITLSSELQPSLRSLVLFRLALELAWLRGLSWLDDDTSLILASHAAAGFLACIPMPEKAQQADDEVLQVMAQLAHECPSQEALQNLIPRLRSLELVSPPTRDRSSGGVWIDSKIYSLWRFAAAAETLIVSGGDERLSLDGATGCNRYGCSPCRFARH